MSKFDAFEWAVSITLDLEGNADLSRDSKDPGNWTSGKIGKGKLVGSKYGITAASYPNLDIPNLTLAQAKAIYRQDYWEAMGCPSMTRHLAALVFDSAVQHGVSAAKEWLVEPIQFEDVLSARLRSYAGDSDLNSFAAGWFNRLATLLADIAKMPDSVDTIVFDGGITLGQVFGFLFRQRMDGGFLWRERTLASGIGGKIDIRGGS